MPRLSDQLLTDIAKEENPEPQEETNPPGFAEGVSGSGEPDQGAVPLPDKDGKTPASEVPIPDTKTEATPEEKKPEEKKEAAPSPARFKVKIDGEEREVDQEELVRGYQLSKTSYERLQKATQAHKDARFVLEAAAKVEKDERTGKEVFNDGVLTQVLAHRLKSPQKAEESLNEWAIRRVGRLLKEEDMTDEQRASIQRQRELDQRERALKAQEDKTKAEIQGRLEKEADAQLDKDLKAALTATGLAETPTVLRRIGQYLAFAHENDLPMTADEAARLVKQEREKLKQEIASEEKPKEAKKPPQKDSTAFPSTGSADERESPAKDKQRAPRGTYASVRKFHDHMEELASR